MFEIIINNTGFWFNLAIPFVVSIFLLITNKEFILKEFAIQFLAITLILIGSYFLLFSTTTDLVDNEVYNGKIVKIIKEEPYDYNYDCSTKTCDSTGNCRTIQKTCTSTEPEKRYIVTSNKEKINISKLEWNISKNDFRAKETKTYRSNQTSFSKLRGEGDIWIVIPNKQIPTSVEHSYINYVVVAKHNIVNRKALESDINYHINEKTLLPYPTLYSNKYGATLLNRVIDTTNSGLASSYLKELNMVAMRVGKSKQANPIIYITNQGRDFKNILETYYKGGKKNDTILILGVDDKKDIVWADSISWSKTVDFSINIGNVFTDSKFNLNEVDKIVSTFENSIVKYYIRKPMEEFKYLSENITLPIGWQVFIFLLNVITSFFLFRYFLKN